ncbi:hypothetical protein SAMN04487941_2454 [Pontibacter akesuensis]|uniref:Uncharacterized protein n=2 Tax=Pontibacter akesuensis TaxID=388950 RepID=A0A1I7J369_9BACT|nr:hypothetical protein [Pontibacter akesuensis]GHA72663.1 hypothetical protein GCM10007389_28050 [Pontibacter akesuensis]SFU79635.1 hypothetical protein SAMN04487941_2454 [Pontibacter akesuensis]
MNKYPIPFYLNQKFVFDIIAIAEDGFSSIQTIKSSDTAENSKENRIKGEVGLNNVFAFLGVSIGGDNANKRVQGNSRELEFQKVHTPNSLFAKMRASLTETGIIRKENFMQSSSGEFVEFKAILRKNPIIDNLESYFSIFRMALSFDDKPQGKPQKQEQQNNRKMLEQFEGLVNQLKTEGSLDLVGEHLGEEAFSTVLTIDRDYLNDPSLSDIADGEFTILGKVIKVINQESGGSINLLRKTSLSKVNDVLLSQMFSGFQNLDQHGLKNADFKREVEAPVIQVVPIAIFT